MNLEKKIRAFNIFLSTLLLFLNTFFCLWRSRRLNFSFKRIWLIQGTYWSFGCVCLWPVWFLKIFRRMLLRFIYIYICFVTFYTYCMAVCPSCHYCNGCVSPGWPDLLRRALRVLLRGGGAQEAAEARTLCACAREPHPHQRQCQPPRPEILLTSVMESITDGWWSPPMSSLTLHILCFENTNLWFDLYYICTC